MNEIDINSFVGRIFLAILMLMLERLFDRGHSQMSGNDKQKISELHIICGKYFVNGNK